MHVSSPRHLALFTATGLAALVAISPAAAQAQDVDGGIYVTGRVGAALPSDFNLEGVQDPQGASPGAAGAPANVETQLDSDVTFSGAIGYKLPTRLFGVIEPSFEIEYTNTSLDVDGGSFNGGNQTFLGDLDVETFTVNYQADFALSEGSVVTPFLAGGLGIADVDSNILYFPASASAPTFGVIADDTAFTYHTDAGVRFDLSDTIALDARVRYQRVDGLDLERRFVAGGNDAFNANVSGDFETVNLLAGVRFSF
ncbi:MAG: outer membrane beta-barrel protein [Pseudomonadota bacterium]